ncbi:MAG: glycoside hydrolase family 76 protein [Acidobacteriales bacterium]|nr:glycoside hydrolase family 76 protein [Terriglobales bacterium]
MRYLSIALLLLFCLGDSAQAAPPTPAVKPSTIAASPSLNHAQAAVDALQQWYTPANGLYWTTNWWNAANAITALANYSRVSKSTKYLPVFANTLHAAQTGHGGFPGFINDYYDDEGWWALAWIDVYDLTGEARYLQAASGIFDDMQRGWDTATCGGGVWWSKKTREKNAIENELFLAVAASLANRVKSPEQRAQYLAWAQKEWEWFRDSGMINSQHLVNDGLNASDPAHCTNNGKNTWSYNQGVILGALVELNRAAPNPALRTTAAAIALAAIEHLSDANGVLRETSSAHTGGDVPQFKGIFSRNLMLLDNAFPDRRYQDFARTNARSLWEKDRDAANHFGFWWAGPFDLPDAARQSSALDALIAAVAAQPKQQR